MATTLDPEYIAQALAAAVIWGAGGLAVRQWLMRRHHEQRR